MNTDFMSDRLPDNVTGLQHSKREAISAYCATRGSHEGFLLCKNGAPASACSFHASFSASLFTARSSSRGMAFFQ